MRLTLIESERNFFQVAECTAASLVAHACLVWLAVAGTHDGMKLPSTERDARVFFLLPPDRVDVRERQSDVIQWGREGGDFRNGQDLFNTGPGWAARERTYGARQKGKGSGARGELPFGPPAPFLADSVFSVLEVDEIVRYQSSAAPIYPKELIALGMEGVVQATYVVDTAGRVDTSTVKVMHSDDPRFTASVRSAMESMRFQPARKSGKLVRQLVEQKFRFKLEPGQNMAKRVS
jgi:TonB family protein